MIKKIGIVTGGGDCPGLNAVIRAVAKAAAMRQWECVGILGGFEGLLEPRRFMPLDYNQLGGLLVRGGTILGTASSGKFAAKVGMGETRALPEELLEATLNGMKALNLAALVCIGGDGSLSIALQMYEYGIPVVGVPKTIDNDVEGTVLTFGFDSAVACATDALDRLHTTAESHHRIMVLEVMGRHAGWIALYAGIAGGADVILIPEIPFDYQSAVDKIRAREKSGKPFTLVVAAEGAHERGADVLTADHSSGEGEVRFGGIGAAVTAELSKRTGKSARSVVLGHLQRGGGPTTFDRVLCSMFGAAAVELIAAGDFGSMVAYGGSQVGSVPLSEAVGSLKTVPADGMLARTARALGISLGD